ncbi:hypothetical protein IM660_13035 [Ruania alkalisoli]|uniref:Uncharacterized protein n=1 Tax=Ruania alkalisoli TaxID=2779775 RepID=A0A7M1SR36_9MICO|nr:hypothetical protein [Ruania alkalisoli]QOR69597.1 hypothetical protein IM660_13035 [Ruania alkalisoli]
MSPIAIYDTGANSEGFGALTRGALQLQGGCVVYQTDSETLVPVYPDGTEWDADGERVLLADGSMHAIGDEIELAGGQVASLSGSTSIPAGCPSDLEYYIVVP